MKKKYFLRVTIFVTLDFGSELRNSGYCYDHQTRIFEILNLYGVWKCAACSCKSSSLTSASKNVKLVCMKRFPGKCKFMYWTLPTFWVFCNFFMETSLTFLLWTAKPLNLHWNTTPFLKRFELEHQNTSGFWSYFAFKLSNSRSKSNVTNYVTRRKYISSLTFVSTLTLWNSLNVDPKYGKMSHAVREHLQWYCS